MDFMHNPAGYSEENLSAEAKLYLENCGALQNKPIKRAERDECEAITLYADHGSISPAKCLEVKVCAQHHNGVAVDAKLAVGCYAAFMYAAKLRVHSAKSVRGIRTE